MNPEGADRRSSKSGFLHKQKGRIMVHIQTERLKIRCLREEDCASLFPILSDPAVMRYIEPPFTLSKTTDFIRTAGLGHPPPVYAIVERVYQELIGHLIWHPYDDTSMELGWILKRDRQGLGYATELTRALLEYTDRDIVIECDVRQEITRHIAEKMRFQFMEIKGRLVIYRYKKHRAAV